MKKTKMIFLIFALSALLSCCSGKPQFDDPEMQGYYDKISVCMENGDWDGLVTDTGWYLMRKEEPVLRLAAKNLDKAMKNDDLDYARELLTSMSFDFINGNEYYASNSFMSWMVNRFANEGTRFIKKAGEGGYYDTHADELMEFVNYDENSDVEYVSKVWYSGDFALNIYTSRIRSTGELIADHSVGLYVCGTCVFYTNDSTVNINGDSLLKGYVNTGSYYELDGYILCNTGTTCLSSFILTDTSDGGYCYVNTQNEEFRGKQVKIG